MPQSPWLNISDDSDFSIHNLPYGIFSTASRRPRVGVAIGEYIIDMAAVAGRGKLHDLKVPLEVFEETSLNAFMRLGKAKWKVVRQRLLQWISQENSPLEQLKNECLVRQSEARMHLPVQIGDYTDFYASEEHATNVGTMFRGKENALLPNWKHMPIAYHGRTSSIVVSGTDIHRPKGQIMPAGAETPVFAETQKLDFELEMAAVVGKDSQLGHPVSTEEAEDYIFGFVLFNDWSARDIQRWEYVPLGPFLGKNFASSISPWIVPLEALQAFQKDGPEQIPNPLPYLQKANPRNFDVQLEVSLQFEEGESQVISQTNFRHMYWSIHQQIAHHTVNGCNLRVGDLLASGTISGKTPGSQGSMLELSWNGERPLQLNSGVSRSFVEDGDTIRMRGFAEKENIRIGFGEVTTKILPAL
ncbi:fumarylacetoacetase [Catalinimonas niigatensis]|uniref:fumarylacetoacetase n=1 Tax=Catalinimonas niigatensis TaxID=1397264 RepID=UPI0026665572|nr:fumarylacetoacetase [Catalinimonas niigatensis]WPP53566.1 fumarylacetoacetase [Catalinimonas niigatensis]